MKHLRSRPCGSVEPNLCAQALRFVANHLHRCFFRGRGRAPQTVYRPKLSAACKQIASNCQVLVSCNYQVFPLPWETFRASQNQAGGGPGPNPGRNLFESILRSSVKVFRNHVNVYVLRHRSDVIVSFFDAQVRQVT